MASFSSLRPPSGGDILCFPFLDRLTHTKQACPNACRFWVGTRSDSTLYYVSVPIYHIILR